MFQRNYMFDFPDDGQNRSVHDNPDNPKTPECSINIDKPIIKFILLNKYRLDFFHQGRNRIFFTFCGALGLKAINSVHALKS